MSSSPPSTCKGITILSIGDAQVTTTPVPALRDDYILVRTTAVGLNPTDWKAIDGEAGPGVVGCRVGCDYAGIVESVGATVTKPFKKGDRICGIAHGVNQRVAEDGAPQCVPEDGAFAEYIQAKGDLAIKIPEGLKDEETAGLGVGVITVGQGLYQALGLRLPTNPSPTPTPILINGGSTATGMLGIQFAKLSGYRVIATCSPHNADYLKSLGADTTIDYREYSTPDKFASKIHSLLDGDNLTLSGGKYRSLLPPFAEVMHEINPKVDYGWTLGYTVFGDKFFRFNETFEANAEDYEFAKMFWELTRSLLESGKLKAPRQDVNRGGKGLEGVLHGLEDLRNERISGAKLVYTL